jgi:hypothetical protein
MNFLKPRDYLCLHVLFIAPLGRESWANMQCSNKNRFENMMSLIDEISRPTVHFSRLNTSESNKRNQNNSQRNICEIL